MEHGLAFFGKMSASFSHEINNVINTISEVSGLLGDLVAMTDRGKPLKKEKLKNITANIADYSERGQQIIKRFNHFAHSPDDPTCETDLNHLLDNLASMSHRLVTRMKMNIETNLPDKPVSITTKPFLLEMMVFDCIESAMNNPADDVTITVSVEPANPGAKITIMCPALPAFEQVKSAYPVMEILLDELQAEVEDRNGGGVSFSLPANL